MEECKRLANEGKPMNLCKSWSRERTMTRESVTKVRKNNESRYLGTDHVSRPLEELYAGSACPVVGEAHSASDTSTRCTLERRAS